MYDALLERDLEGDTVHEECGVFGVYAPGADVARLTFFGLYALQHRGQESAGIAVATPGFATLAVHRHMGLVSQAFTEGDLARLRGDLAIGHTRYSTTGSSNITNASPFVTTSTLGEIAVAHNGNLTNADHLRAELEEDGERFLASTDSEIVARLIGHAHGDTIEDKLRRVMPRMLGAYSLTILTPTQVVGVRDPLGVRPLSLGRLPDGGWVIASESCAFTTIGAELVRDIEPGEIVVIDGIGADGLHSYCGQQSERHAACIFESIYLARPDSAIGGQRLHLVRQRMGAELAKEHPVEADVVIPAPDSATPAALGYARQSGIPYAEALIKNRYIGRTFIQPDQRLRELGVGLKFNALPEVLAGKRVVLVEDSIVRGTTSRPLIELLRKAGAVEVHMRVHSPPMRWPCYLGVDTGRRAELIAARMSIEEIRRYIGADTLGYLSEEGLARAIDLPRREFCFACFNGNYPVSVQMEFDKLALETPSREAPHADMAVRGA
ncbi:MAG: amidophosphoribosyltransferase [Thermomicrobiales bacterium]|nr:amidophosphoribosyltransferase [Thermomicrobiales bacterium]